MFWSTVFSLTVAAAAAAEPAVSALPPVMGAAVAVELFLRGFLTWSPVGGEVENCTGDGSEENDDVEAATGVTTIIDDDDDEAAPFSDMADEDELE